MILRQLLGSSVDKRILSVLGPLGYSQRLWTRSASKLCASGRMTFLALLLTGSFFASVSYSTAGTVNGLEDPDRILGRFIVVLRRDHITSLRNPALSDPLGVGEKSTKWRAAKDAADVEVGHLLDRLKKAHPRIRISAVMSVGPSPGFVLGATDEDAKALANEDDVAEVNADVAMKNVTTTSSQSPAPSWGLERIDQLPGVNNPSAWVNAYNWIASGAGVDAYILDSGIMTTNTDFGGRATNDADFVGDNNNGWCSSNLNGAGAGHGTEVASIVGGTKYGVAKSVRLHSVRVVDCNAGSTFATVLEGLEWISGAVKNKKAVLNISLEWLKGNLFPFDNLPASTQSFVNQSNVWLSDIATGGTAIVIASGNNDTGKTNIDPGNCWPQDLNSFAASTAVFAFVVGATAYKSDNIWSGTSLGTKASGDLLPNIFAPGDQVTTAWISSTTATISTQSGTSLAAPHVAGVLALAMQASNPSEFGCDDSFVCVVTQSAYSGAMKGDVQGGLNIEVSSLVPGNNAPATSNASGGSGGSSSNKAAIAALSSIISTLLL